MHYRVKIGFFLLIMVSCYLIQILKMFKGTFPKDLYSDFIKFFYDISLADKNQAILIKKES